MNNRKRLFAFLAVIMLLAVVVSISVACDNNKNNIPDADGSGNIQSGNEQPEIHNHSFSDKFSNDENYHWYDSTCEHILTKDKAQHSWDNGVITTQATCTTDGVKTFTCAVCGRKKTEVLIASGHSYPSIGTVTKDATCTEDGVLTYKCANCSSTKETSIPASHSYSFTWKYDNQNHWHEATCGHDVVVSEAKHDYDVAGVCKVCKFDSSNGLRFGLNNDGSSYYVIQPRDTDVSKVVIPSEFKGLPVTRIGENAFSGCSNLTSVDVPDSVTVIDARAFSGRRNLKSISIPNSVTIIGASAFSGCSGLQSVTFDGDSQLTEIHPMAFSRCDNLESLVIPKRVTKIYNNAFSGCSRLKSIVIPAGVVEVGTQAFSECSNLKIYCEAPSQPSGWNGRWNEDNLPVEWGYRDEEE